MYKVKIFGAGSIGNHLCQACRRMGWEVLVTDISSDALDRMKNDIYPTRYGKWDDGIELSTVADARKGDFDLIFVGTPPNYHLSVSKDAIAENPKALIVEKPVCTPNLGEIQEFARLAESSSAQTFVGYDHVVGGATNLVERLLSSGEYGTVQTIDAEFREHWQGIFNAHPWLSGPQDTYLGFWEQGGGATGEHSHGINLWQHFAHIVGQGSIEQVSAMVEYRSEGKAHFDAMSFINVRTDKGLSGRIVQDVVTLPVKKLVRITCTAAIIEWRCNYDADGDAVVIMVPGKPEQVHHVAKKRPDDFLREVQHIDAVLAGRLPNETMSLGRGLDTMMVVAAAHESNKTGKRVQLDLTSMSFASESLVSN